MTTAADDDMVTGNWFMENLSASIWDFLDSKAFSKNLPRRPLMARTPMPTIRSNTSPITKIVDLQASHQDCAGNRSDGAADEGADREDQCLAG